MEYLTTLDQIQTIEKKTKFMDLKFRITDSKINGETIGDMTLETYAIFYACVINGPRPKKMIRTREDFRAFKSDIIDYLTIERIFNIYKNGDILQSETKTRGAVAMRATTIYLECVKIAFKFVISSFKRANVLYSYAKEFKKLTLPEKNHIIRFYDLHIKKRDGNENENKIKRFMDIEKKRIENPETLDFEEQKRTLRGYKCGCGGAYQREKNDRHFLTTKHLLYIKRMELQKQN
jgi:hypothetical protein